MTEPMAKVFLIVFMTAVFTASCETEGTDADAAFPTADSVSSTAQLTPWNPDTSTTAVPTFGKTCRLTTTAASEFPSNGLLDDSFQLSANNDGGTLGVIVNTGNGQVLNAQVSLERGLKDKSFRYATGQASWGLTGQSGTVVDGTVCFPVRLNAGTSTELEFSLIIDDGMGTYHSVSGYATVPGNAIVTNPTTQVNAMGLDIRLD